VSTQFLANWPSKARFTSNLHCTL